MECGRDVTKKKTKASAAMRPAQGYRDDDVPARSLSRGHSVFDQPPLLNCSWSKSQKRHHNTASVQAKDPTPTQSPAQKTVKLRSLIVKPADGFCLPRKAPYHTMWETPDCMITYICSLLTRAMVEDQKECMKYFGSDAASLTRQCMASSLYAIVVWKIQGHRVFPEIPSRLENEPCHPRATVLPEKPDLPKVSCGDGWKTNIQAWWKYFMALIQTWCDAGTVYPYSGPIREDSKLLYYVFFRIKWLFVICDIPLELYAIKNRMPWVQYSRDHFTSDDQMHMCTTYAELSVELHKIRAWLLKHYECEAEYKGRQLGMSGGDIDELKFMRTQPDKRPGNEANYKPEPELPAPSTRYILAGAEGNTDIHQPHQSESLERHRHRQTESREHRCYAESLDPCIPPSPTETFPSPVHRGMLPAPSAEANSAMTNRLIIEQYRQCHEEVSQHDLCHTPTFDENDEELDYYCEQASQESLPQVGATTSVTSTLAEWSEPPPLEDENALLQGPVLPSTFSEEAALLDPSFASTLSALEWVPVQFLDIVANRINALRRGTARSP